VIVDHCSCAWGNDGTLDIWNSHHVTVQWTLISETLGPHSLATQIGGTDLVERYVTLHHNLWAHNNGRNPYVQGNYRVDIINNVIYNWGDRATTFHSQAETSGIKVGTSGKHSPQANVDGNYFIAGPNTDTVGSVANDPIQLGTSGTTNDECAPAVAIGVSASNKTQAYFGRSVAPPDPDSNVGSNVVGQTGANPLSTNLTDLDKDRYHAGASGAPLWPATYSTVQENAATIDWPASRTGRDPIAAPADVAYSQVLGVYSDPAYGAGARLVFSGAGFPTVYGILHDTLDWRVIMNVMGRTGFIKFDPVESEIPK
jgi:hypothetical protein